MIKLTHIFRWLWDASKGYRLSITAIGLVSTLTVAVAMANVWISKRLRLRSNNLNLIRKINISNVRSNYLHSS